MPSTYGSDSAEKRVTRVINQSFPLLEGYTASDLAFKMVEQRAIESYIRNAPWPEFIRSASDVVPPIAQQVGNSIRDEMKVQGIKGAMSFDVVNDLAVRYAQLESTKLVANLQNSQRAAIRDVLARALSGNLTVHQAAQRIRNAIGLHPAWALAVDNFNEKTMKRLIAEGMAEDKAFDRAQILTDRYRMKLLRRRSQTIARNEIHIASSLGRLATFETSIRDGYASKDSRKEFSATPGCCSICAGLDGEIVKWDAPFSNGEMIAHAHIGCRCAMIQLPPDYGVPELDYDSIDWSDTGTTPLTDMVNREHG